MTTPEEARQFVAETKVDVLAPAVGNSHGMVKSMVTGKERKHLAIGRIREIKAATGVPLTLHGGSGTADGDREAGLAQRKDEVAPYKILPSAVAAIHES